MRKLALLLSLFLATAAHAQQAPPTTVIVARHAERAAAPANDPVLTAEGEARARALAEALRGAGVTHVITTNLARTRLTAAPTAQVGGIQPVEVDARSPRHIQEVVDAVRARAGGVVLVVGHSNTVPAIVNALGGQAPAICDNEYDNLYVLTIPASGSGVRWVRSRYGDATPVGADCQPMVPVSK